MAKSETFVLGLHYAKYDFVIKTSYKHTVVVCMHGWQSSLYGCI